MDKITVVFVINEGAGGQGGEARDTGDWGWGRRSAAMIELDEGKRRLLIAPEQSSARTVHGNGPATIIIRKNG